MGTMRLTVQHDNVVYEPCVEDDVKLERETNAPSKLTFTIIDNDARGRNNADTIITEGDIVRFYYDDIEVFLGFVFTKKRDRDRNVEVTCYDQIRYMKNKFTYVFEKRHAHTILQLLCDDLGLKRAAFAHTLYPIPYLGEESISALDMINDALETTLVHTGEKFVMYDDFGKIQLKNSTDMKSRYVIAEHTAENFDYKSSIDDETYNQIVLYYKKEGEGEYRDVYTAQSSNSIAKWGLLRHYEETKSPLTGLDTANKLLKLYNRKTREFSISGAFGDVSVRGGTLIPIKLILGDVTVDNYMLVDKVTHNFKADHYTMDLTVSGDFGDSENTTDDVSNKTQRDYFTIWITLTNEVFSDYKQFNELQVNVLSYKDYEVQTARAVNRDFLKIVCDAGSEVTIHYRAVKPLGGFRKDGKIETPSLVFQAYVDNGTPVTTPRVDATADWVVAEDTENSIGREITYKCTMHKNYAIFMGTSIPQEVILYPDTMSGAGGSRVEVDIFE